MSGRPTKYSEEKAEAICKDVERGNTFRVSALLNGISYETLRVWREEKPAFSAAIAQAEAKAARDFVNDIVFASRKGDWNAAKFWLTHRNSDEWRPPKETKEISGPEGGPLVVERVVFKGDE